MRTAFALGVLPLLFGCHRLPDEIPYHVQITEKDRKSSSGLYEIVTYEGAKLLRDGRPVGTLKRESDGISLHGRWSGPKAELRATMAGAFAMETEGICGPFVAPIEGMPDNWLALTDGNIAKNITNDQEFRFYLHARLPERLEVIVDWGAVTGKLEVGKLVIAPGTKKTSVITGGCEEPPAVRLNGREIGTLDRRLAGSLITLEPGVCHAFQTVAYGDAKVARPSEFFKEPVAGLREIPSYVLEGAPYSVKSYGGKGATSTQLVRVPCR